MEKQTGTRNILQKDVKIDINNDLTYEKNKNDPPENENLCFGCGCLCFGSILVLAFIAAIISYIVFGIMYLVQDYEIAHECSRSNLWAYCLTAIILSLCRSGAKNSTDENGGNNLCILFCIGVIELSLAIWGGIELWQNSCDNLSGSNLWKFGLATFCIQSFCAFIFVIIIPLMIICCK